MTKTPSFPVPYLRRIARGTARWSFLVIGLAAFVLGFAGFMTDSKASWSWDGIHRALLGTLQLYVLEGSPDEMKHLPTQLASLLAPIATVGAAVLAFHARLRRRWTFLRLRAKPADELFIGGGELAAAILLQRVQARRKRPPRVAALDTAADTPLERVLERAGGSLHAFAVRGDGRARHDLLNINAMKTRRIWVLTGDDLRNLEIARALLELYADEKPKEQSDEHPKAQANQGVEQYILVCVRDSVLARATRDLWPESVTQRKKQRIEYFDLARIAARQLLKEHPPVYPAADSGDVLHLCVIGKGDITGALLVHAATHCIYAEQPGRAVRVTLFGPEASATLQQIYRRYPALHPDAIVDERLEPLLPLASFAALDIDPAQLTPSQWQGAQTESPFAMAYVSAEHDPATFAAARRLLAVQDVSAAQGMAAAPVVACLNDRNAGATESDGRWPERVHKFDIFARCFHADQQYPAADADERAKLVNEAYEGGPWDELTDSFRWSSRLTADHMDVKLALMGLKPNDPGLVQALEERLRSESPPEPNATMRWLMQLEHRRFVVERLIDGWLLLKPAPSDNSAPSGMRYKSTNRDEQTQKGFLDLNDTLVPFNELTEGDAKKDWDIVQAMRDCIEKEQRAARESA